MDSKKVEAEDLTYIGHGHESIVVKNNNKPEQVIAFSYLDMPPERAIRIYYMQRIYAILFPHNFPHFFAARGGKNSMTHRQEIIPSDAKPKHPFEEVTKICEKWEIPQPWLYDPVSVNFLIGLDGGEYYVDQLFTPQNPLDLKKALMYMKNSGYSNKDQEIVRHNIDRIINVYRKYGRLPPEQEDSPSRQGLIYRLVQILKKLKNKLSNEH